MNPRKYRLALISAMTAAMTLTACSKPATETEEDTMAEPEAPAAESADPKANPADVESEVIVPGLSMKVLRKGYGQKAQAGDIVEVHYTGWLYAGYADNNRGDKFDSSVDRGDRFQFPLGAGRVIKGWDQGVEGMMVGEVRELTIAPEMGYGDRGAGGVIPPGATLVFEVELFGVTGPDDAT